MLIDISGEKVGLVSLSEALEKAQKDVDLVQVSPKNSNPVVCKLMDYGKHIFAKKRAFQIQNPR